MTAVIFAMYGSCLTSWHYFIYEEIARETLLGKEFRALTTMRGLCRPPADQYHGPYLIKETVRFNNEYEKLRLYVNELTPEQLKELKI